MTRHTYRWLFAGSAVLFVAAYLRLRLTVNASVLGTSVSCGNAIAYLAGNDNTHPKALEVCGGSLQNASIEGILLLVASVVVLIAGIVVFRSKRRPMAWAPGWYPSPGHVGFECWWDGRQWTGERPPPATGSPSGREGFESWWWDGRQWIGQHPPPGTWPPPAAPPPAAPPPPPSERNEGTP
jgi:hypothetical protein